MSKTSEANARTREAMRGQAEKKHKKALTEIPETVLQGLKEVRFDGEHNMLEWNSVIRDMLERADNGGYPIGVQESEYHAAILWLLDNEDRYMEALKEMGARRVRHD